MGFLGKEPLTGVTKNNGAESVCPLTQGSVVFGLNKTYKGVHKIAKPMTPSISWGRGWGMWQL